jgi:hypothetical protein
MLGGLLRAQTGIDRDALKVDDQHTLHAVVTADALDRLFTLGGLARQHMVSRRGEAHRKRQRTMGNRFVGFGPGATPHLHAQTHTLFVWGGARLRTSYYTTPWRADLPGELKVARTALHSPAVAACLPDAASSARHAIKTRST